MVQPKSGELCTKLLGDASKNCTSWTRGWADPGWHSPAEFLTLNMVASAATGRRPRTMQLVSALWTLQEKLGLFIWTAPEPRPENLLLVMESRNFIRLDRPLSLDNWEGRLYIEPFNVPERKWFWFQFDFDKVMER